MTERDKRIMNYRRHVIWASDGVFMVALKRDGTDNFYGTIQEAMDAIDKYEDEKQKKRNIA